MMEARPTASFPVVFYDGEREIDIGDVGVHPAVEFRKLQSILSQKIGIAPHQFSLAIICRKKSRSTRKIPISDKVNFVTILQQEKDCYFLASLKSSRRARRGGGGRNHQFREEDDYYTSSSSSQIDNRFLIDPPLLLRRDSRPLLAAAAASPLYYDSISSPPPPYANHGLRLGFRDYENQLQIQKENYLMSVNPYPYKGMVVEDSYEYSEGGGGRGMAVCEACFNANGRPVPFHWCVYDPTTVGFRSPAGPIARPSKG